MSGTAINSSGLPPRYPETTQSIEPDASLRTSHNDRVEGFTTKVEHPRYTESKFGGEMPTAHDAEDVIMGTSDAEESDNESVSNDVEDERQQDIMHEEGYKALKAKLEKPVELSLKEQKLDDIRVEYAKQIRALWSEQRPTASEFEAVTAKFNDQMISRNPELKEARNKVKLFNGKNIFTSVGLIREHVQSNNLDHCKTAAMQAITLVKILDECGIDFKTILNDDCQKVMASMILKAGPHMPVAVRELLETIISRLTVPARFQTRKISPAATDVVKYIENIKRHDVSAAEASLQKLREAQDAMCQLNETAGFELRDRTLPMGCLEYILQRAKKGEQSDTKMRAFVWALYEYAQQVGHDRLAADLSEMRRAEPTRGDIRGLLSKDISQALPRHHIRTQIQARSSTKVPKPVFVEDGSDDEDAMDTTQRPVSSASLHQPPSPGIADSGSQTGLPTRPTKVTMRGFAVKGQPDNVTPIGKVEHVQKLSDRHYRAILNVGTEKTPVYVIKPGADLGRGTAASLHPAYSSKTSDMSRRKAKHIQDITDMVEVDQSPSAVRAPITKFRIVWVEGAEGFEGTSLVEWVTRSELQKIAGKPYTENCRKQLRQYAEAALEYLRKMKKLGLHPDTKQKLTEEDMAITPWLCPDAEATTSDTHAAQSATKKKQAEKDNDTSHVRVGRSMNFGTAQSRLNGLAD